MKSLIEKKKNMKDKFYKFVKDYFEGTPEQQKMLATVEASPWHREDNVWVHTGMVLDEFEAIQKDRQFNDGAATIARLALLFHDTGKPAARTQKESPERGVYHSYPGHEQMSARDLEDYAVTNWELLKTNLGITDWYQVYAAAFLIEIHLPYDLKDATKREMMARAVYDIEKKLDAEGLFAAVLRGDARGRISDDKPVKLQKVEDWIKEFYEVIANCDHNKKGRAHYAKRTMYYLLGASGSGKTTFRKDFLQGKPYTNVFSNDELQLDYASTRVEGWSDMDHFKKQEAGFQCMIDNEKDYKLVRDARFLAMLEGTGEDVIVDVAGTGKKYRNFFVMNAKQKGFKVVAICFPVSKQQLLDRAAKRADHKIPHGSILNQWNALALPSIGEFDEVEFVF